MHSPLCGGVPLRRVPCQPGLFALIDAAGLGSRRPEGERPPDGAAVLNHTGDTGGAASVTAVYDRNAYLTEKRRALGAWADLLLEIVAGQPRASNVVQMAR